jgi:hypothetical protein
MRQKLIFVTERKKEARESSVTIVRIQNAFES